MKLKDSSIKTAVVGSQMSQQFGISDNKIVYDILRNKLYQDPIGAICREIACNSRDANRENGKSHIPIQIKISDSIEDIGITGDMSISFKDSGPGINPERMNKVFLLYGESTKRDSNTQTGGFGLGAKTPFAYSDTFSIITVCPDKNGKKKTKYVYVAAIDESEKGSMYLFRKEKTTEETGTEIIVPIKSVDRGDFERKSLKYTQLWDVQAELINFRESRNPYRKYSFEGFDIYSSSNNTAIAVVDGIPYPTDLHTHGYFTVGFPFENGVLDLGAGRETLQDTQTNKKIIRDRHIALEKFAHKYVTDYIKKKTSQAEAVIAYRIINLADNAVIESMNDEDYLAHVFNRLKGTTPITWSRPDTNGNIASIHNGTLEFRPEFHKFEEADSNTFSAYSRRGFWYESKIADRFWLKQKTPAYVLDTDDRRLQRLYTLYEPEKKSVLIIQQSDFFSVFKNANHNHADRLEEEFGNDFTEEDLLTFCGSDNPTYSQKMMKSDYLKSKASFELECEIVDILFDVRSLKNVAPTKYKEAVVKPKGAPTKVLLRTYYLSMTNYEISYHDPSTKIVCGVNKDFFGKHVVMKMSSMNGSSDYDMVRFLLVAKETLDLDITISASASSYSTMVRHGAIPAGDFIKNLTAEQMTAVKKTIMLAKYPTDILHMIYAAAPAKFDKEDLIGIDEVRLNKPAKFNTPEFIDVIVRPLHDRFIPPFMTDIIKATRNFDAPERLMKKYPMLDICKMDKTVTINEKQKFMSERINNYINTYMELIQAEAKKKKTKNNQIKLELA
jgi:hypothetical protein